MKDWIRQVCKMPRCKDCDACGFVTPLNFIRELGIYLCCRCMEKPFWKEKIKKAKEEEEDG